MKYLNATGECIRIANRRSVVETLGEGTVGQTQLKSPKNNSDGS